MEISRLSCVYFSPTGNTKKVLDEITPVFEKVPRQFDIMKERIGEQSEFAPDELLIVAVPVFEGRVPQYCLSSLGNLYGNGTAAIAVCVFGNRDYDDALIELCDILGGNGFSVVAAAAFASEHSILHRLGRHRPDEADIAEIRGFASMCRGKIDAGTAGGFDSVHVSGERPYRVIQGGYSLVPTGDDSCTRCGKCAEICPVGAIDADHPELTDPAKCMTCMACAAVCPVRCRMPRDPRLPDVLGFLMDLVGTRAPNDMFFK